MCFGGADWKVVTVTCHTSLSFLTGNIGNSCKDWVFCLLSVPWGKEDCLWVSLSVFHCLTCHYLAAALQDLGNKEHAEVLELTPLQRTGALGRSNLSLNRLRLLSMEFRKVGQESCSGLCVWYFISTPVAVPPAHPCGSGSGHFLTPAGMAGWVTPLPLSPLWLLHREHRRFWTFRRSWQSLLQWSNLPSLPF